jgi:hypothetical protein
VIPEATAWFTGEALMEYEDDGEEEEEGSEGDDAEEEDDSEVSECVCVQRGCGG